MRIHGVGAGRSTASVRVTSRAAPIPFHLYISLTVAAAAAFVRLLARAHVLARRMRGHIAAAAANITERHQPASRRAPMGNLWRCRRCVFSARRRCPANFIRARALICQRASCPGHCLLFLVFFRACSETIFFLAFAPGPV